ncbi:MAG TPA: DUF4846 domain-containing protein [Pedobacter sp.]
MPYPILLLLLTLNINLSKPNPTILSHSRVLPVKLIYPKGKTLASRISVPTGFERIKDKNGLTTYFRNLPVKQANAPVRLYNGGLKNRQDVHAAVIKMEIGNRDLQQCADAVMRLRAEYLFKQKKYSEIHFKFTSGDIAAFTKYAEGYRPVFNRDNMNWFKKASASYSYQTFRKYLDLVFSYAGTASLEKELKLVQGLKNIKPGDVFIRGGFPGHAVMVVDVAVNTNTGEKLDLLSQSYMPAQETHIIKNPENNKISPWYSTANTGKIITPEWTFSPSELKRFSTW